MTRRIFFAVIAAVAAWTTRTRSKTSKQEDEQPEIFRWDRQKRCFIGERTSQEIYVGSREGRIDCDLVMLWPPEYRVKVDLGSPKGNWIIKRIEE